MVIKISITPLRFYTKRLLRDKMRFLLLSTLGTFIIAIYFSACTTEAGANVRSIYMLLDPSKEELAHKEKLQETFSYVINDLSPGDSLVIHTPHEILSIDFSNDDSKAYVQKRNFRRKMMDYIKNLQPRLEAKIRPTLDKAKAYLDTKIALHKSIIYCNPNKHLTLNSDDLEGYTISMLNLSNKKEDLHHVKTKVETANGRFLVASNIDELTAALAYR